MIKIPDVTADKLIEAMDHFDTNLRHTKKFSNWEENRNQLYAVVRDDKRYPPKEIISSATGLPVKEFGGGKGSNRANGYLEERGFKIIRINWRNPDWSRDELIIALDFYLKHRTSLPSKHGDEIAQLSRQLVRLGKAFGIKFGPSYRNSNGVWMKLNNFLRLDPEYTSDGKVGLWRGAKTEKLVWAEFAEDPGRCADAASAILELLDWYENEESKSPMSLVNDDDDVEAAEGKLLTRIHKSKERDRKIVKKKKEQAMDKLGKLVCECCGFDFEDRYGDRGRGYIECHHRKPVSELKPGSKTKLSDLALVCANCHRMIHAKRPWLEVAELAEMLAD